MSLCSAAATAEGGGTTGGTTTAAGGPSHPEMCSGSEAGSYLRLIDVVYHSALGLRVIKKKRRPPRRLEGRRPPPQV